MSSSNIDPRLLTVEGSVDLDFEVPLHHVTTHMVETMEDLRYLPSQMSGSMSDASDTHQKYYSDFSLPYNQGQYFRPHYQSSHFATSPTSSVIDPYLLMSASSPENPYMDNEMVLYNNGETDSDHKAQSVVTQSSLPPSQSLLVADVPIDLAQNNLEQRPKFYCGEPGCDSYRTDDYSHKGRHAMSVHYRKKHRDVQFDRNRLVSSASGERSRPMSRRQLHNNEQIGDLDGYTEVGDWNNEEEDMEAGIDNESHTEVKPAEAQEGATTANLPTTPVSFETSHQDLQPRLLTRAQIDQLKQTEPAPPKYPIDMPRLPRMTDHTFTEVLDLHITSEDFISRIKAIRASCDHLQHTLRGIQMTYTYLGYRPFTPDSPSSSAAFLNLRRHTTVTTLERVHVFITRYIGDFGVDVATLGHTGDVVIECSLMACAALQKIHMPPDGVWPAEGTVGQQGGVQLDREEMQRRFWCCELQSVKLSLFVLEGMVREWSWKVADVMDERDGRGTAGLMGSAQSSV